MCVYCVCVVVCVVHSHLLGVFCTVRVHVCTRVYLDTSVSASEKRLSAGSGEFLISLSS